MDTQTENPRVLLSADQNSVRQIYDSRDYLIGYALFRKSECEIHNFVSPTLRILRFLEGSADWMVNDRLFRFQAGDIVLMSNVCKRNIHKVHSSYILYEMFDFYPTIFSPYRLSDVFYSDEHLVPGSDSGAVSRINPLLNLLRDEIYAEDKDALYRVESIKNLVNLLAVYLFRIFQHVVIPQDSIISHLSQNLQYITEHISEPLSVASLAAMCGYTQEHYSRLFRKYFGISPIRYITGVRLENVLHLICNRNLSILDAAFQSGYQSSSAFYKSFRNYYGATPTQYLNTHMPRISRTTEGSLSTVSTLSTASTVSAVSTVSMENSLPTKHSLSSNNFSSTENASSMESPTSAENGSPI